MTPYFEINQAKVFILIF